MLDVIEFRLQPSLNFENGHLIMGVEHQMIWLKCMTLIFTIENMVLYIQ